MMGVVVLMQVLCVVYFFSYLFSLGGFLGFWIILEVLTLSVIPFFFVPSGSFVGNSVFHYLLVAGLSSFFLAVGTLGMFSTEGGIDLCVLVGVYLKLGVFPFLGWAYEVVTVKHWGIIWIYSCLLKVPFIVLMVDKSLISQITEVTFWFCSASFIVLAFCFWTCVKNLGDCWCTMMLSSCTALAIASVCCESSLVCFGYVVYFVWSSVVLVLFYYIKHRSSLSVIVFFYIFILLSLPFCVGLFYKFMMSLVITSAPSFVLICWVFYSVSEQLYLFYCLVRGFKGTSRNGYFSNSFKQR